MGPDALEVFLAEYKWPFPVGVDRATGDGVPTTMAAYQMQGTPTLLLFDRTGRLRRHYFGRPDDMLLSAEIMALVIEDRAAPREQSIAIERKLAAALTAPEHTHGNDHDHVHHDGCGHDHSHDHGHGHDHHAPAKHK